MRPAGSPSPEELGVWVGSENEEALGAAFGGVAGPWPTFGGEWAHL